MYSFIDNEAVLSYQFNFGSSSVIIPLVAIDLAYIILIMRLYYCMMRPPIINSPVLYLFCLVQVLFYSMSCHYRIK